MNTEKTIVNEYLSRLTREYHYPPEAILEDVPYSFGKARYRLDLVVMKEGKPHIVIEAKAPCEVSERSVDQLLTYSRITRTKFAVLTNGYIDRCYKVVHDTFETRLEPIPDIPSYQQTLQDLGRQIKLETIEPPHLRELIQTAINLVREREGISLEKAANDILKLLTLKIYDENVREKNLFRIYYGEAAENVKSRVSALAMKATKEFPTLLKDPITLSPQTISTLVSFFQKYSIKDSGKEIIGLRLPVDKLLGSSSFEFSSPKYLVKFAIDFLKPTKGSTFIDPACGVGGLLLEAATRGCEVTGLDYNVEITKYATLNLAMSGFIGNVFNQDSLQELVPNSLQDFPEGGFDYAAVIPPFSQKIGDIRLNNFLLGRGRKKQSVEALFLERTLMLLRRGGKMVIVLPEGFLFNDSFYDVREFILKKSIIRAIISLPSNTFEPASYVKTSLLLLEHSPERGTIQDDEVFVGFADHVEDFNKITLGFEAFQNKKVTSDNELFIVTNLSSAHRLDASYLKGLLSIRDWEQKYQLVELQDIANLTTGTRLERVGKKEASGSHYYVKAGDVRDLVLELDSSEKASPKENIHHWTVEAGDILMTRAGTVGRVALVQQGSPPIVTGSNVVKISLRDRTRVLPEYLVSYLRSSFGQEQIRMNTGGSAIKSINISGMRRIKIPVPPIERQRKVASKVGEIIKAKHEAKRVIAELRIKRNNLLHELDDLVLGD